jgi:hypothetical protein
LSSRISAGGISPSTGQTPWLSVAAPKSQKNTITEA